MSLHRTMTGHFRVFTCLGVCVWLAAASGCSQLPSMSGMDLLSPKILNPGRMRSDTYRTAEGAPVELGTTASGSMSMETYQKIKEAKAQNAVVLQVQGDATPIRVLPLPNPDSSAGVPKVAYVSELLTQTGVMERFGNVSATVYRPSPESITGLRMDVNIEDGVIDPVTDYALQPGDRVHVIRHKVTALGILMKSVLRR